MQITHTQKSDAFLLANVSENFENMCLEMYELDTDLFCNDETCTITSYLKLMQKMYKSRDARLEFY